MTTPYKLTVRIGDAEFLAEGSEDTVKTQFDLFLMALKHERPKKQPENKHQNESPRADETKRNGDELARQTGDADRVTLDRVFELDSDDLVTLKAMPATDNSEADAIVMILYGFHKLTQKGNIFAPTLVAAARKTGIQADRIYRLVETHKQYIMAAGVRRGKKYSLNNKGQQYATELIRTTLRG
jgi:hypothetical protein